MGAALLMLGSRAPFGPSWPNRASTRARGPVVAPRADDAERGAVSTRAERRDAVHPQAAGARPPTPPGCRTAAVAQGIPVRGYAGPRWAGRGQRPRAR